MTLKTGLKMQLKVLCKKGWYFCCLCKGDKEKRGFLNFSKFRIFSMYLCCNTTVKFFYFSAKGRISSLSVIIKSLTSKYMYDFLSDR